MEKKKLYTKTTILNNYTRMPPTPHFDRINMEKLGVYSEESIDPISLKVAGFNKDMLFIDKHYRYKPEYKKIQPAEDKKEVTIKDTKVVKMAMFSFITNYMKLNTKGVSWHYSLDGKTIKGPFNSEEMDKLWKEDILLFDKTLIYSNEISFTNPKTNTYNKKELNLEQFIPIDVLTDSEVFNKIRLQEEPVAVPIQNVQNVQKPAPAIKPEKKKEAKKAKKKKISNEEKAKQQELMKSEGFAIASKKGKSHKVEDEGESSEESDTKTSPVVQPKPNIPVAVPIESPKQEENDESSEEDDFEYMPSRSQVKKKKKKASKAPSFQPEIYTSVGSVVPSVAKKEHSKKTEVEKHKAEVKDEEKEPEQKKVQPSQQSSKKRKNKRGPADPSILGFHTEPPKPKLQEPEGWGDAAIKPKEVLSLADIMKEEALKKEKGKK